MMRAVYVLCCEPHATDETICCESAEPVTLTMKPRKDLDELLLPWSLPPVEAEHIEDPITNRWFKDVIVKDLSEEYRDTRV